MRPVRRFATACASSVPPRSTHRAALPPAVAQARSYAGRVRHRPRQGCVERRAPRSAGRSPHVPPGRWDIESSGAGSRRRRPVQRGPAEDSDAEPMTDAREVDRPGSVADGLTGPAGPCRVLELLGDLDLRQFVNHHRMHSRLSLRARWRLFVDLVPPYSPGIGPASGDGPHESALLPQSSGGAAGTCLTTPFAEWPRPSSAGHQRCR
jgi:hypothetical protein